MYTLLGASSAELVSCSWFAVLSGVSSQLSTGLRNGLAFRAVELSWREHGCLRWLVQCVDVIVDGTIRQLVPQERFRERVVEQAFSVLPLENFVVGRSRFSVIGSLSVRGPVLNATETVLVCKGCLKGVRVNSLPFSSVVSFLFCVCVSDVRCLCCMKPVVPDGEFLYVGESPCAVFSAVTVCLVQMKTERTQRAWNRQHRPRTVVLSSRGLHWSGT